MEYLFGWAGFVHSQWKDVHTGSRCLGKDKKRGRNCVNKVESIAPAEIIYEDLFL